MKLKYINQIKSNITIPSHKKTEKLLEGTYQSIYKGKSLNFENLREYVLQDDVKDIDWKASARSGTLLVKQFIALKKHNIMIVLDTGTKMNADTEKHQSKKEIALYIAGTIGYLANHNGDAISFTYAKNDQINYTPFRYQLYHLEKSLWEYDKYATLDNALTIDTLLNNICKNEHKKMIVFVITDIQGIDQIQIKTLKKLNQLYDVLFFQIKDNFMFGENVYDLNQEQYIPDMILQDTTLHQLEKELKNNLLKENQKKLQQHNMSMTQVNTLEEIPFKIVELLKKHQINQTKCR